MANTKSGKAIFVGEFSRPMDEKRRLTLPSKWRFSGDDEDNAYLALPNPNGSIILYPPEMLEQLYAKVSQTGISNQARQKVLMKIFRKGESIGCDKQGRISLTEKLTAHAGIKKDTTLIGNLTTIQIWNPDRLCEWSKDSDDDEPLDDVLAELGL